MPSFSVGDYDFSFNKEKNGSLGFNVASDNTDNSQPQDASGGDGNNFSFGIKTPSKKTIQTVQKMVNEKSKSKEHLPQQPPQEHAPPPPMPMNQPPMMHQQYTGVSMQPQPQHPGVGSPMASPGVPPTVVVTHQTPEADLGTQYQAQLYAQCASGNHDFETKYGPIGIILAIVFFPIGLLCLGADARKRCTRCGEHR